jgi:hypothetical protein
MNLIEQTHPSSGYRVKRIPPTITDRHNGTAAISSLRCRARSTEPGAAEERTEKISVVRVQ